MGTGKKNRTGGFLLRKWLHQGVDPIQKTLGPTQLTRSVTGKRKLEIGGPAREKNHIEEPWSTKKQFKKFGGGRSGESFHVRKETPEKRPKHIHNGHPQKVGEKKKSERGRKEKRDCGTLEKWLMNQKPPEEKSWESQPPPIREAEKTGNQGERNMCVTERGNVGEVEGRTRKKKKVGK